MPDKNTIYIFDIDGTITQPTQPMDEVIARGLMEWSLDKVIYFATGSEWEKASQQLNSEVIESSAGIFCCSGSQFYHKGMEKEELRREWEAPKELEIFFETKLAESDFLPKVGGHISRRVGMINFSTVGRLATLEERLKYSKWDTEKGEREEIKREASSLFPYLEFHLGGQISIDCYPTGWNKGRVIRDIKGWHPDSRVVFFGDKLMPGGNDFPIIQELEDGDLYFHVRNPNHTLEIIKKLFSN